MGVGEIPQRGTRAVLAKIFLTATMALLAAACSSSADTGSGSDTSAPSQPATAEGGEPDGATTEQSVRSRTDLLPTISLGVTGWTGARLNVAIAEQLIELRLGYPVQVVEIVDTSDMLADLGAARLDAVLEVWPSGLEPTERELIESGAVADLGELGVIGKTGWYVPRYVVDADPSLGSWEAYADRSVAARFSVEETGALGRFLGTDPSYEQFDEELIEALGLPFTVVYSGSEEDTAAELERATANREPVLMYWWTPTAAIARFDLVNVALPERTAACVEQFQQGGLASCDYPEDRLLKLGAIDLAQREPVIERFLRAFSLTTNDQLALIDAVENEGRPIDQVAAEWIMGNESTWRPWLG